MPDMVIAQAEADKVKATIVKALTDAKVDTVKMGLEDDRKRDELDAKIAIEGAKLGAVGAELDQDAIQMADRRHPARGGEGLDRPDPDPDAADVPLHGPTGASGRGSGSGGTWTASRASRRSWPRPGRSEGPTTAYA